ncbi:hypothetical protein MBLNU457_4651t1 [Dothideomycetes sp. NU457]
MNQPELTEPSHRSSQPRPSLFNSNSPPPPPQAGESSSRIPILSVNSSSDRQTPTRSNPGPLSTLASAASASNASHNEEQDEIRATASRRRIPRVEKDNDDPTLPVQNRRGTPNRTESTTFTTLNRLFAVQSPSNGDSRSHSSFHTPQALRTTPSSLGNGTLSDHLFTRGLLSGRHSDITVHAFGSAYRLHRLVLDQSTFFSTAFSGQWAESSSKEMTLHPEDIDSNINQISFELALKRLYGASVPGEEDHEAIGLFATGFWLEMPDLVDSSIESILRQMRSHNLTSLIKLVTTNYYGRAGDKILASAKAMLCRDGWKMPLKYWDGIPADIIREIVGGDGFFINGEWDRWLLAKRLLDRRLKNLAIEAGLVQQSTKRVLRAPDAVNINAIRFDKVYRREVMTTGRDTPEVLHRWIVLYTHPDIEPLLVLLDEGIHYIHLDFEHLQHMRKAKDSLGLPMMPEKVISNALWMQMELRQKVLNAQENDLELNLSHAVDHAVSPGHTAKETGMGILDPLPSNKGKQQAQSEDSDDEDIPSNSWDGNGKPRKFWIPSTDCNIVMGGNADPVIATSSTTGTQRHTARLSATIQPEDIQWAADFSAASADTRPLGMRPGSANGQISDMKPVAYSRFPPFRFAVEFPNPRMLKENKRFYSRTIFYAGSLWNIYIQKKRSNKNPQLGVYLHRAKECGSEEAIAETAGLGQGTVDERIGLLEREMLMRADRHEAHLRRRWEERRQDAHDAEAGDSSGSADPDATLVSRNTLGRLSGLHDSRRSEAVARTSFESKHDSLLVPTASSTDDDSDNSSTNTDLERLSRAYHVPTLPPYVDGRPTIKTYFKIYSPSKRGRMLSVYESAPDKFNFSQSWGWKSNSLMLDEGMLGDDEAPSSASVAVAVADEGGDAGSAPVEVRKEARLKFMVVIGNV